MGHVLKEFAEYPFCEVCTTRTRPANPGNISRSINELRHV